MSRIRLLVTLTILLALGLPNPAYTQERDFSKSSSNRLITDQLAASRVPGVALGVVQGDRITYKRGYGVTNDGQPVTSLTQFHIGSLSKTFTATAIMQLVDAGDVDLDASVQTYLPDLQFANDASITIRQLLNHTSGLSDASFNTERFRQLPDLETQVNALNGIRQTVQPGTFAYTNINYAILGRVIEMASGEWYTEYLQANIFEPLDMVSTVTSPAFITKPTESHITIFGFPVQFHEGDQVGAVSASGIISTSKDMSKIVSMFVNEGRYEGREILTPESVALMFTPPDGSGHYGMGWYPVEHPDYGMIYQHSGDLRSYHADMIIIPALESGFVTLYNANNLLLNFSTFQTVNEGLIRLLDEREPAEPIAPPTLVNLAIIMLIAISVFTDVRQIIRLPAWRAKNRDKSTFEWLISVIGVALPAVIALLLPTMITAFTGRTVSYVTMFALAPELIIWLGIAAILGLVQAVGRLWLRPPR